MLIAILIVTLLVFIWGKFSEYQSSKDELANIENVAKFNEQFANYDRNNVQGYELISLINKILDYNKRYSSATGNTNDIQYSPIIITINMGGKRNDLIVNDGHHGSQNLLFESDEYVENPNGSLALRDLIKEIRELEEKYGGADNATRIAKNYNNLFPKKPGDIDVSSSSDISEAYNAVRKYNTFVKDSVYTVSDIPNVMMNKYKEMYVAEEEYVYKCYEYMQFKRLYFKSKGIKYNDQTSRIEQMKFEATSFVKQ